ncbi:uncharacterized protein HMPREF1120_02435 [Exophiala dermatitidis NIH/UT8656]|uniref:F-box domain-containing protein n=1 Tax=Exophiala dermatitidis (strain ATCC 34100 / CBS 525.76 / NIH/UT8656) TaxID=858893 RepID=H6BSW0_EXODN|nr:uncharacterized protein HMPREF1120_02435 [Exophiala dermatitidis NIH/UT8656]EHY54264.1 hypothetical protein HMPREF1120_02435 [Exophiala dermatitidis NIH/UT8656]
MALPPVSSNLPSQAQLSLRLSRAESRNHPPILALPPELHLMVTQELSYPDVLALKLCHPYFHGLLDRETTIQSRVQWIVDRARLGLPIPRSTKVSFRSDASFVAHPEIGKILRQRLRHHDCLECETAREFVVKAMGTARGRTFCFVTEEDCCPHIISPKPRNQQLKWLRQLWVDADNRAEPPTSTILAGIKRLSLCLWMAVIWLALDRLIFIALGA